MSDQSKTPADLETPNVIINPYRYEAVAGGLDLTNLLIQYYFDEGADEATTPTQAEDDGIDGMHLDIDFGTSDAKWDIVSGNTALNFLDNNGTAIASHSIGASGNVIRDNLHGAQTFTIEIVLDLTVGHGSVGRVFGTTGAGAEGSCMVVASDSPDLRFRLNESEVESWAVSYGEKHVWHIVVDTAEGDADDRVKIYKDGVLFTSVSEITISQNATVDIQTTEWICVMNRETDVARETEGILYYAAIYDTAFDATRASDHYDVLSVDDDTP